MTGPSDGRSSLPWASLLDPVANARALGDIQAQALRAAGELVERLAAAADEASAARPASAAGGPTSDGSPRPTGDASRLIDAWVEMLQRVSSSFGGATPGGSRPQAV